jgi:pilus assembly protein CpaF
MEGNVITTTDIFTFEQTGFENGRVVGELRPTGLRPKFMERIETSGIHLPPSIFGLGRKASARR